VAKPVKDVRLGGTAHFEPGVIFIDGTQNGSNYMDKATPDDATRSSWNGGVTGVTPFKLQEALSTADTTTGSGHYPRIVDRSHNLRPDPSAPTVVNGVSVGGV